MARRTFDVVDVTEIFIHWYAGRSISEVSVSLGVDRKTIRKYLAAVAAGLAPGWPGDESAGLGGAGDGLVPAAGRHHCPQIAGHHEYITEILKAGMTQATIHQ